MTIDHTAPDPTRAVTLCRQTTRLMHESCEGSQTTIAQSTQIISHAQQAIESSLDILAQHRRKAR